MEKAKDGKYSSFAQGALAAEEKVGLKMNVPENSYKKILSLLAAMHSPRFLRFPTKDGMLSR